jgi:carbon-monoxide dehydrogenase medium subunit
MVTAALDYIAARSCGEVLAALADGDTWVLAGGQSLVLDVTNNDARPRRVVDINRVAEFAGLAEVDGMLRVAPLVRHRDFESGVVGGALGDLLRAVVTHIGHPPIRARGTVLGSLAYAHPAAEWPVLATILDAELDLLGPRGCRTLTTAQFFTGQFTTARRPEELLAEVRLSVLPAGTGVGFAEQRRYYAKFAEAAAMAAVTVTDGRVSAARIGLVNAGPCPVRARAAEKALIGTTFSDVAVTAAAEAAATLDAHADRLPGAGRDSRRQAVATLDAPADRLPGAGRDSRRHVVALLTRRALTQARERM